jgi:Na+/citrate or Na+/malate symporter
MEQKSLNIKNEQSIKIAGLDWKYFMMIAIVVLGGAYLGVVPKGMIGAFPLTMVIGGILDEIGNRTPIIKDYFGGGPMVVIFGTAALSLSILPESAVEIMKNFTKGEGFLTFFIAALITGSILGMDRKLLMKASVRYFPAILGGLVCASLFVGVGGVLIGYGFKEAILYIAVPIMGGGMGAGAIPISEIFSQTLGTDPTSVLSKLVPALALGNAMAIVAAGFLNKLGKIKPSLSGEGKLMVDKKNEFDFNDNITNQPITYKNIGFGILISTAFLIIGRALAKVIPVHYYALMIISVAIVKALDIIPERYTVACYQWYQVIVKNFTPAVLVGIGVAYTDINAIIGALSIQYVVLVAFTVTGAIIGSGLVGKLVGFYFIESALTAGLCMANMGGTGDVAVLGASKRMELMPFAQISSRLGGAIIILIATFLIGVFS